MWRSARPAEGGEQLPPFYFANPTGKVWDVIRAGLLGAINTPMQGSRLEGIPHWIADNGCGPGRDVRGFASADGGRGAAGKGWVGDDRFLAWLESLAPHASRCWFATAPDVPGDAEATLARSGPFLPVIRGLGYKVALVAQNGLENLDVPWDSFDVLFLGGDTAWKLGPDARRLTAQAADRGKTVHMGRVNSMRRWRYAQAIGCASVDGTYLTFAPDNNLPILLGWLRELDTQECLF